MIEKRHDSEFTRGWLIGDFKPALANIKECEVAIKYYLANDYEPMHYHKVATEYTYIIKGKCSFDDWIFDAGDIAIIHSGHATLFKCIEDAITVVIKTPSVKEDKYFVDNSILQKNIDATIALEIHKYP